MLQISVLCEKKCLSLLGQMWIWWTNDDLFFNGAIFVCWYHWTGREPIPSESPTVPKSVENQTQYFCFPN